MPAAGQISFPDAQDKRFPLAAARGSQSVRIVPPGRESRPDFDEIAATLQADANGSTDFAGPTTAVAPAKSFSLWEKGAFAFGDFIDIINPLQHVPVVATLYRQYSGDEIGPAPRVIGGALWGRFAGLAGGLINSAVEWFTGKDVGDHVYATLFGKADVKGASAVARAQVQPGATRPVAFAGLDGPGREAQPRDLHRAAGARPAGLATAGQISREPPTRIAVRSGGLLRGLYLPEENRWEIHDGDDRRVRFTV